MTSGSDSGAGTLRQTILDAAPGDTINFAPNITLITLTTGELDINKDLTIAGPGANLLTVQRGMHVPNFRIFFIQNANAMAITVAISGLTISNGNLANDGAGIWTYYGTTLTLSGCTVSRNMISGTSNIATTVGARRNNHRAPDGLFTDIDGGGINNFGVMSITNCTISGNSITLNTSTSGGGATGGGIFNMGTLTITNSTISGNAANGEGGGGGEGGGIANAGTITIVNSTISNNSTDSFGGGIYNYQSSGSVNVRNTIIAGNLAATNGPDVSGTIVSQGYNLIGDTGGATIAGTTTGNQLNVDPLLNPLQDNGGPTQTQALQPGSPATDKGHASGTTTDQRGFPRPVDSPNIPNAAGGDGSDIGAYEDQIVCETVVTNNNDSGLGSLRYAIANVCAGGSITFAPSVVSPINLTSDELWIQRIMTITGPGANLMTVQRSVNAGTNFSIFHISSGGGTFISGLTISKGNPNHSGGGVYMDNGSILNLTSCAVTGNSANSAGQLPGHGGGIAAAGIGTPAVDIVRCTIAGNSATGDGGGVWISSGTLDIDTSTISGNTAANRGGGVIPGGATRILNSTISNNSAFTGGGVWNGGVSVNLGNTIIAKNTVANTYPDFSGTFTSQEGYNLIGNDAGTSMTGTTTGDQVNVDPSLGPLQNNGGPTQTHALLTNSPAIDKGFGGGVAHPDQRGANRPYDDPNIANAADGEDIGAFEVSTLTPTSVVSRMTQGAGTYDINLPLAGTPGIECRSGGATSDYQVVVTFPTIITLSGASVTSGTGSVLSVSRSISGTQVTVNLTGVGNAQIIAVTLSGVSNGVDTGNVTIQMGVLVGDTNGNGTVNSSDVSQTKLQSGQIVTSSNFREDVNTNGSVNSSDVSLVKLNSGTALP